VPRRIRSERPIKKGVSVKKRRSGGGRKPVVIANPFVIWDKDEEDNNIVVENVLRDALSIDIRIEDLVVGCVRCFNAGDNSSVNDQEYVNWNKVIRVYKGIDVITRERIENYLNCSKRQSERYVQVIKFCNKFITRWQKQNTLGKGSMICGYQRINRAQLEYI
jgi:hypothetical protein